MLHWVIAPNICFVCCTGSLRQTDFLFVALSHCYKEFFICFEKDANKVQTCCNIGTIFSFWHFLCLFFVAILMPFFVILYKHFGIFCATYTNFFCCSDSVRQTKNPFVAMTQCDKKYWKKISNFFVAWDNGNLRKKTKTNIL